MSFQSFACLVPSVHKLQFVQVMVTVSVQQIYVMCTFLWVLCWMFSLHKTMTSNLKLQSQKTYEQITEPSYPHLNHRY